MKGNEILRTDLGWNDLVLRPATAESLDRVKLGLIQREQNNGVSIIFIGPPGTGKTLAAAVLGNITGLQTYRVDLSQLVAKYIGETEKNLNTVFEVAEESGVILFFDEADALFGLRTGIHDAKDRFFNQETSFLLQRIEAFEGVVILTTNCAGLLDDDYRRIFDYVVEFQPLSPMERERIQKLTKKRS